MTRHGSDAPAAAGRTTHRSARADLSWVVFVGLSALPATRCAQHAYDLHASRGLSVQAAFGLARAVADRGKDALDRVRGSDVFPMLGREVIEGQQYVGP